MIQTLSPQDVKDILVGATLFGAGGGGDLAEGFALIDTAEAAGKPFRMMALADAPDDALIATPYLLGAISDIPEGADALVGGTEHPVLLAYRRLSAHVGAPIFGVVPCELGGSNTAVPFFVAAMEGAVVIDADPAGRAVPEITHSSYFLSGLPASPIATANARGETMLLEGIADDRRAEEVVRTLAQISNNDISAVDHALPARDLRGAILTGTLSCAQALGRLWREGQDDPAALPATLAQAAGGQILFQGMVRDSSHRTEGGFTLGAFTVDGTGSDAGSHLTIDFKNENMAARRNGAVCATIPEIITVMDQTTGAVLTNPHVTQGQSVAVLVLPAPQIFTTPEGLAIFGPAYAGIDAPYTPLLKERRAQRG